MENEILTFMRNKINQILNKPVLRIKFRDDITALRAIAVIFVLLYHADFKIFQGGWLGVDIFFVISGYLISNIVFSELIRNSFSFKEFYKRRAKRILPAVSVMLIFSIPFSYFLLIPKELINYSRSLISSLFFYSNYYFRNLDFYNSPPAKKMPLIHMWTLSIEEQFYLIFPLFCSLVYFLIKKKYRYIVLILFIFSLFLNSTNQTDDKFYFIQYRAWEFLLGVLIMFIGTTFKTRYIKNIGILIMLFGCFYFTDSQINQIEPKLFVLFGTSLFLMFEQHGLTKQIINSKFVNYIGLSSFSIYLFHQPIFSNYRVYLERSFDTFDLVDKLILIIISLFIGYYSWKYIELYYIKHNKLLPTLVLTGITIIISLSFYLSSENTSGFKYRYNFLPEEVIFYSMNTNFYPNNNPENLINWKNFKCGSGTCNFYNEKNKPNIYIFGDSHANIFSVSVVRDLGLLSENYNISIANGDAGRCLLSGQVDSINYVGACERSYFEEFIKRISKNDFVVATGRFDLWLSEEIGKAQLQCKECNYKKEFKERLTTLAEVSNNLIIFYPHPTYEFPIAKSYLYKQVTWGEAITMPYSDWLEYVKETKEFLDQLEGNNIVRINSEKYFCDETESGLCYASSDTKIFYTDNNHLTFEGVIFLTKELEKNILTLK